MNALRRVLNELRSPEQILSTGRKSGAFGGDRYRFAGSRADRVRALAKNIQAHSVRTTVGQSPKAKRTHGYMADKAVAIISKIGNQDNRSTDRILKSMRSQERKTSFLSAGARRKASDELRA